MTALYIIMDGFYNHNTEWQKHVKEEYVWTPGLILNMSMKSTHKIEVLQRCDVDEIFLKYFILFINNKTDLGKFDAIF